MSYQTHETISRLEYVQGSDRGFGMVFGSFFLLLALYPLTQGAPPRPALLALAGVFYLVAWRMPRLLAPFNRVWSLLGYALGRVMQPLILGVVYFGVLTPMGILARLAGKDLLTLRFPKKGSMWKDVPQRSPAERLRNQF